MNWKKFLIAFVAAFVVMYFFAGLWWGTLLKGAHNEVPALWRTPPQFTGLLFGHAALTFFFTLIFVRGFGSGGGVGGGLRCGVLIGLLFAANDCILFAVQPLTAQILGGWIIGDILQFGIGGLIVGALYKPGPAPGGI